MAPTSGAAEGPAAKALRLARLAERFAAVAEAFTRAKHVRPDAVYQSSYRFAGRPVRLCVVGRGLAERIGGPFAHLRSDAPLSAGPELTVDLWDEAETGIPRPENLAAEASGWVRTVEDGVLTSSPDGRFACFTQPQALTWLDRQDGRIVGWRARGDELSMFERGKPVPVLLPLWYRDRAVQIVHAGLVSRNGQGVLIAGPGGAGKSTTALACLSAGFDYLGDDHCGLQDLGGGSFEGHSLYNSARLKREDLIHCPTLGLQPGHDQHGSDEKALILVSQILPGRVGRSAPIKALVLPRLSDARGPSIRPASKPEALLQIVPSSIFFMPLNPRLPGVERLLSLVDQVPSFWLALGRDLATVPDLISRVLE